jgi:hypothetical protein
MDLHGLSSNSYAWDKDKYGNTVLHVRVPFVLVAATNISN